MTQPTTSSTETHTTNKIRRKKSFEMESELIRLLEELDEFQRKVEEADESPASNEKLGRDLERLLRWLDVFQQKLEEADEDDMFGLQELLTELQEKMTPDDESESSDLKKKKDKLRGKTAEKQLELYTSHKSKSGWSAFSSPQGLILKNVVARKKQEQRRSKNWLTSLFSGDDEAPADDPPEGSLVEVKDLDEKNSNVLGALRESNTSLKETVSKLESAMSRMEETFKKEINTYQKVIMQLQQDNIELHYKVEALTRSRSKEDPIYPEKPVNSPSLRETAKALYSLEKHNFLPLKIF
jgi:hypothetical protein